MSKSRWRTGLGVGLVVAAACAARGESLGIAGSDKGRDVALGAFEGLPAVAEPMIKAQGGEVVSAAKIEGRGLIAIVGDFSPRGGAGGAAGEKHVKAAVEQLNLLRPDLVLTVGNLVEGMSREGGTWVKEWEGVRGSLETLTMPWYPCVGEREVVSGTRVSTDRRFEGLYQKHVGPLYYSLDAGEVHAVVLNSEEAAGGGIGAEQVRWLKGDLARVERSARTKWIVVTMHRPLWRLAGAGGEDRGWGEVQRALGGFNRRPIVSVEGAGARGPRVVAVFAGHERAYAMDPGADGIRYCVLGPTGAMPREGEDASTALRGIVLLKLESKGVGGVFPAVLTLGGEPPGKEAGPLLGEDAIGARERGMIDGMAGLSEDQMGVTGVMDEREEARASGGGVKQTLKLVLKNPLKEPLDVSLRMASTKFLTSPSRREGANVYVEGLDLPWELSSRHMIRHLEPGKVDGWALEITRPGEEAGKTAVSPMDGVPPQLEMVLTWGGHEVVLKRRVAIAPSERVTIVPKGEDLWARPTAGGGAYAWTIRGDEPRKLNPTWQMTADGERVYLKVRVDDGVRSYWPGMGLDGAWGGIASDAVSFGWMKPGRDGVQRVWVVPFAPAGEQLWTNEGIGERQTGLLKLDPKWGVKADVKDAGREGSGYEVTLSMPRELVFGAGKEALANISVHDNDGRARTWVRGWSREEDGRETWGRLEIGEREAAPAVVPAPVAEKKKEDLLGPVKAVPDVVWWLIKGLGGGK